MSQNQSQFSPGKEFEKVWNIANKIKFAEFKAGDGKGLQYPVKLSSDGFNYSFIRTKSECNILWKSKPKGTPVIWSKNCDVSSRAKIPPKGKAKNHFQLLRLKMRFEVEGLPDWAEFTHAYAEILDVSIPFWDDYELHKVFPTLQHSGSSVSL